MDRNTSEHTQYHQDSDFPVRPDIGPGAQHVRTTTRHHYIHHESTVPRHPYYGGYPNPPFAEPAQYPPLGTQMHNTSYGDQQMDRTSPGPAGNDYVENFFNGKILSSRERLQIAKETANTVAHLHKEGKLICGLHIPDIPSCSPTLKAKMFGTNGRAENVGVFLPYIEGGRATVKSDIFSLGSTIHWILTGQRLFDRYSTFDEQGAIEQPVSTNENLRVKPMSAEEVVRRCRRGEYSNATEVSEDLGTVLKEGDGDQYEYAPLVESVDQEGQFQPSVNQHSDFQFNGLQTIAYSSSAYPPMGYQPPGYEPPGAEPANFGTPGSGRTEYVTPEYQSGAFQPMVSPTVPGPAFRSSAPQPPAPIETTIVYPITSPSASFQSSQSRTSVSRPIRPPLPGPHTNPPNQKKPKPERSLPPSLTPARLRNASTEEVSEMSLGGFMTSCTPCGMMPPDLRTSDLLLGPNRPSRQLKDELRRFRQKQV
ncbi:hypothetical protein M501DRAFT_1016146 [Patellaria atrata CBS 101060]|uniref:Protein kinase domain-containing protein n=1 Tax=Patellaria atrata CBS 101060 TaxID=1346257 RepID=A0A9P4SAI0_9PEZI|nr:hypothetical protein M501DRAFT_1016146 [Patellaria atrata CBS 101060]